MIVILDHQNQQTFPHLEGVQTKAYLLIPHINSLLHTHLFCSSFKDLWQQLSIFIEVVSRTNINQGLKWTLPLLQQFCGVVFGPFGLVLGAKVTREGLLTPGAVTWICNRSQGRNGFVFPRVFEEL